MSSAAAKSALQGGFAFALDGDGAEASFHAPAAVATDARPIADQRGGGRQGEDVRRSGEDLRTGPRGGMRRWPDSGGHAACPRTTPRRLRDIEQAQQQYDELRKQRRRLRRTYLGYLLLLTVGVLFASTWLALYLSKMVTRPLLALAEATQEISRGRLDYRVDVQVGSEIGQLVNSFNQMAADLEAEPRQYRGLARRPRRRQCATRAAQPPHRNHPGEYSHGRSVARRVAHTWST